MADTLFIKRLRLLPLLKTGTFNRPANTTAYDSGDIVANDTTAGSVVPCEIDFGVPNATVLLRRMLFRKSGSTTTNAVFRVHVFTAAPTVANGDNGALSISTGAASYVGTFSTGSVLGMSDGVVGSSTPNVGSDIAAVLGSSGKLYCLVEALAAYTPASGETFTLTMEGAVA